MAMKIAAVMLKKPVMVMVVGDADMAKQLTEKIGIKHNAFNFIRLVETTEKTRLAVECVKDGDFRGTICYEIPYHNVANIEWFEGGKEDEN